MARRKIESEMPRDRREKNDCLLQGETGADADARARAEGQIGETIDALAHVGKKARRIEALGLIPETMMAMQNPGRDHDPRPRVDLMARDLILADGLAGDRGRRRIKTQRLLDHRLGDDEPIERERRKINISLHRVDLALEPIT